MIISHRLLVKIRNWIVNRRRFAWLIMAFLIGVLIWRTVDFKGIYDRLASAKSGDPNDAAQDPESLQRKIADQKRREKNMEKLTLWETGENLTSWLTQQASDVGVKIIRVQRLTAEKVSEHYHVPARISVAGDYDLLMKFVSKLERSQKKVQVNSFNMRRREDTSKDATMELSLSYFQKVNEL